MKVTIDGIDFIPAPDKPQGKGSLAALEVDMGSTDAGDDITIRRYLLALLQTLWTEEEGFSGKRPFGNSGWQYDLFISLAKAGFIAGAVTADGEVDFSEEQIALAHAYVSDLIAAVFLGVEK